MLIGPINSGGEGRMVKAIWAVACVLLLVIFIGMADSSVAADIVADSDISSVSPALDSKPLPGRANYQMGAEDVLRVSVWDNRDLTLDVVVRPDGMISLPLIQDIRAEGLTPEELAEAIRKRLHIFIKDPQVSVVVTQVNAPKIFVIGNVLRPGPYPLRGEMSVLQALSLAGGFNQYASPRSIRIVRRGNQKQEVRKVNYYQMLESKAEGNFLLSSGDTVVVP